MKATNFDFKKILFYCVGSSRQIGVTIALATAPFFGISPLLAQPIIAEPNSTSTAVTPNDNQFDIDGGALSSDGANLFHSFTQFGLDTNQIANFLATPQLQNILGRVVGGDSSVINGLIQVTGGNANLYLTNPAGIIFGNSASLNVPADFIATTATGIGFGNNNWFNAFGSNDYQSLVGNPTQFAFDLTQPGAIINAGDLTASDGQNIGLIGGVVANTGTVTTSGGNIAIAAVPGTNLVKLSQPGSVLSLEFAPPRDSSGLNLPFTALDLPQLLTGSGVETGLTVNPDSSVQTAVGNLIPTTSGTTIVTGTLDVSNPLAQGGNADVLGTRVGLLDNAQIFASGTLGGGNVRVGGDFQGQGTLPTALFTVVGEDATINTNALTDGNGGSVIVWANNTTGFYGTVSAQGGSNSGDGGFVEISGQGNLIFDGTVDVSAAYGTDGTILFDPRDIIVENNGASADDGQLADNQILAGDGGVGDFTISDSTLRSLTGNIILQATRDITFNAGVQLTGGANRLRGNLNLNAGRDITINANIANDLSGTDGVNFTAGNNITVQGISVGGDIALTSNNGSITTNGLLQSQRGNIALNATNDIQVQQDIIATDNNNTAGSISLSSSNGNIAVNLVDAQGPIAITANNGSITADDTIFASEFSNANPSDIVLSARNNIQVTRVDTNGNITLNATNGNVTIQGDPLFNETIRSAVFTGGTPGRVVITAPNGTVELNGLIRVGRDEKLGNSTIEITAARFRAVNPGDGQLLDQTTDTGSTLSAPIPTSLHATPAGVPFNDNGEIDTSNIGNIRRGAVQINLAGDPTPIVASVDANDPKIPIFLDPNDTSVPRLITITLTQDTEFTVGRPLGTTGSGTEGLIGLPVAGIPPTLVVLLGDNQLLADPPIVPPTTPTDVPVVLGDNQVSVQGSTLNASAAQVVNIPDGAVRASQESDRAVGSDRGLGCTSAGQEEEDEGLCESSGGGTQGSILDASEVEPSKEENTQPSKRLFEHLDK